MSAQDHYEKTDTIVRLAMQLMHEHGQDIDEGPLLAYVIASGLGLSLSLIRADIVAIRAELAGFDRPIS
jgi:hypothetical protein